MGKKRGIRASAAVLVPNSCIDDVTIMQIVIHHNYTSDSFVSNKGSFVFKQLCKYCIVLDTQGSDDV